MSPVVQRAMSKRADAFTPESNVVFLQGWWRSKPRNAPRPTRQTNRNFSPCGGLSRGGKEQVWPRWAQGREQHQADDHKQELPTTTEKRPAHLSPRKTPAAR